MRYGFMAVAVLAAGAVFASTAQAADAPRIGVINLQQVVDNSHRGQAAQKELTTFIKKVNGEMQDRRQKLGVLQKQLEKADAKSSGYEKLQKSYQDGVNEYQQFVSQNQQEFEKRRQALLQPIEDELKKVMLAYAKDHHYDILLNENNNGAVYATDHYDLTSELTEAMDKDWAEQQSAASKAGTKGKSGKG